MISGGGSRIKKTQQDASEKETRTHKRCKDAGNWASSMKRAVAFYFKPLHLRLQTNRRTRIIFLVSRISPTDEERPTPSAQATPTTLSVQGAKSEVTLCQCVRCGNIWKPHHNPDGTPKTPKKCPACDSPLWNKPRAYRRKGEEAPTETPKPRGRPFKAGFDERRVRSSEEGDGAKNDPKEQPSSP